MSELTTDYSELISQFSVVTGVDGDRARFHLESAAWNLQVALASFYEDDADVIEEVPISRPSTDDVIIQDQAPSSKGTTEYTAGSRFATLSNLKANESSSDEEEGQAFYAGGSERSGQQVIGPGKKKSNDIVSEMFKAAKEHGAEIVDSKPDTKSKRKTEAFKGTGYRLGATETDSKVVAGNSSYNKPEPVEVTLKMWKTGFSLDEGPLRDYHDPQNADFLGSIRRGEIPAELIRQADGGEVTLNMEDHREEDFLPPKKVTKAFSGTGHMLGSPAPKVVNNQSEVEAKEGERSAQQVLKVDESQPITNVQIRLADGTRLVARLNHTHTIRDLYLYITTARPQYASSEFALMTTFPNKELEEHEKTLKEASLLNAVIVQRLN